jgi:hypothetical protein
MMSANYITIECKLLTKSNWKGNEGTYRTSDMIVS